MSKEIKKLKNSLEKFKIVDGQNFSIDEFPSFLEIKLKKEKILKELKKNISKIAVLQDKLFAQAKYAVLLIFQGMDASGKDSMIKHVMKGINPQGCKVVSFKEPSREDLARDYLWRVHKNIPERGMIGIFNRSHYEEVLIVKVKNLLKYQNLPEEFVDDNIWSKRYRQISDFEKYLYENGIIIRKFFLHISFEEQKKRFLERIDNASKNWKFSKSDVEDRKLWSEYLKNYEEAIKNTSYEWAPWHIIPSDNKWVARLLTSLFIIETLESLKLSYPEIGGDKLDELFLCKQKLLTEQISDSDK